MRRIFVLLCLGIGGFLVLGACQKEDTPKEVEEDPCEEVIIWESGGQGTGFARGKKNCADFEASGVAIYHRPPIEDKVYVQLVTYSKSGFVREKLHIANGVPLVTGEYKLRMNRIEFNPHDDTLSIDYTTLIDGGDILGDSYTLDETVADNTIEIIEVDTLNRIIKGEFTATFTFDGNFAKTDPRNTDVVKFSEVYFETKIAKI